MKKVRFRFVARTKTLEKQRVLFDEANLRSARTILADVNQHGGEGSGPVIWAHAVVARLEGGPPPAWIRGDRA